DLPQIAKLLLTCNDAVRAKAEDAVARVALKNLDRAARADPVLAECNTAPAAKLPSLLRVLGRLGGPKAFTATKDAVRSSEPGVVDAAIRVLADWQDAEALPELRALAAAKNGDPAHRVLALRGFIRLVRQTGDRPASDTLTLLDDAMGLADRPDERKLVLAGLGDLADVQALKRAQAKLPDTDLAEEAAAATLSIARKVASRNRDDSLAAIQAVQAASVKEASRAAAAEAIEFIDKHAGFIANWEYCGPYFQEGKKSADLYDIAFPPEPNAGPLPEKASGPTPPDWKPLVHSAANDPWIFDFTKIDQGVSRCIYVRTTLKSAQAQPIRLELGSDDGIMAWLNGKLIHTNKAARAVSPGDDKIDADLAAGENTLLLKITQGDGGWGFCCAIRGRDGKPLRDFP
ncbi:MAG: hypothetical protein HZB38_06100, partial [Planctomycetes bacterium]|nr:hypothetical protein [Planctomycetota bacterium]